MKAGAVVLTLLLGVKAAASAALPQEHVFGDPGTWRWAPDRSYHVRHYLLQLHFDQDKAEVFGEETLSLQPFQPGFRRFYLDSSGLDIDSVTLVPPHGAPLPLRFAVEHERLWIILDREHPSGEDLRIRILYHGQPRFGLFFENPTPEYPDTPREIWTQGEAEFNHFWFPCWDYPNDMATSEVIVTVPEGQVAVSNGRLAAVRHMGGQVTYDWKESVPHSSYLTSLAIGPWQKVQDRYHGKPVDYYVPRGVPEAEVRRVFGFTPDMLGFFSDISLEYPYEKYAQVTVHDFFFGGMENVSATTLQEWVLQDAQASEDYPATETIAHELAQHWFGDYAQGRDWADIWLNEGFATYLPALYTQHREGYDAYRLQMRAYQEQALRQDREDYLRPIVDRHYRDGMDMFDSITHEKGAAVLDMLRYLLDGPAAMAQVASRREPFFQALHDYLKAHGGEAVDTAALEAELRNSTGRDLGQFFQQWVYMAGTPDYRVSAAYDPQAKTEAVTVTQGQQGTDVPAVFHMPILLVFHGADHQSRMLQVDDDAAVKRFEVPLDFVPLWVDFDPGGYLLKRLEFPQPLAALIAAVAQDPEAMARLWAAAELGKHAGAEAAAAVAALQGVLVGDRFYGVRVQAAASLGALGTPDAKRLLLAALSDQDSRVRAAAVAALGGFHADPEAYAALSEALQHDVSYAVQAAAAAAIGASGMPDAFERLQQKAASRPEIHVLRAIEAGLAATGDPRAAAVLLADAQPGMPVRERLSALMGLAALKGGTGGADHARELAALMDEALRDPYLPLQQTAEDLVAGLQLRQFEPVLREHAEHAPSAWQREHAQAALMRLDPGA